MSYVCVFVAEGFEEIEALTVVDMLRRVGILTDLVSVTSEIMVSGSHGIEVRADKLIEEIEFASVDMIVLPGGMPGKHLMHFMSRGRISVPFVQRLRFWDIRDF